MLKLVETPRLDKLLHKVQNIEEVSVKGKSLVLDEIPELEKNRERPEDPVTYPNQMLYHPESPDPAREELLQNDWILKGSSSPEPSRFPEQTYQTNQTLMFHSKAQFKIRNFSNIEKLLWVFLYEHRSEKVTDKEFCKKYNFYLNDMVICCENKKKIQNNIKKAKTKIYTSEEKLVAVGGYINKQKTMRGLAKELNVSVPIISGWYKEQAYLKKIVGAKLEAIKEFQNVRGTALPKIFLNSALIEFLKQNNLFIHENQKRENYENEAIGSYPSQPSHLFESHDPDFTKLLWISDKKEPREISVLQKNMTQEQKDAIIKNYREAREQGMSMRSYAKRLGIPNSNMRRWEKYYVKRNPEAIVQSTSTIRLTSDEIEKADFLEKKSYGINQSQKISKCVRSNHQNTVFLSK